MDPSQDPKHTWDHAAIYVTRLLCFHSVTCSFELAGLLGRDSSYLFRATILLECSILS